MRDRSCQLGAAPCMAQAARCMCLCSAAEQKSVWDQSVKINHNGLGEQKAGTWWVLWVGIPTSWPRLSANQEGSSCCSRCSAYLL